MARKIRQNPISLEIISDVINSIPNPFGTFKKAKYIIRTYCSEVLYSCITTCRSEEDMLELLLEKSEIIFYMRKYCFAEIVKIQNEEEKILFKGYIFK